MRKCTTYYKKPKFSDILSIPSNPEDLFTLLYPIGSGGFGKVYKALHKTSQQLYAIKIIDYTKGNYNDNNIINMNYKSIQQETSVMRLANESNYIVKYYGSYYSRLSNTIWIILEYCSSGSALDLMLSMERTFSEIEVATIMEMVLKGLIYIHKKNLIHRDIKGANIMLSKDGYAKLGDFGVGIQLDDQEYRNSKKGSPYWMSPQVILNNNYDMKTDIWSLGITCLELVEGEPPHGDMMPEQVMEVIAKSPPKASDIIDVKEHTKCFINFVNLCLETNPKKRPSAEELIKHQFITKFSQGKEYLKQLIEEHINDVEKFRIDKEEYMNKKEEQKSSEIEIELSPESKEPILDSIFQNNLGSNYNKLTQFSSNDNIYKDQSINSNIEKEINNNILDEKPIVNNVNYLIKSFNNERIQNKNILVISNNINYNNLNEYTFKKNNKENKFVFNKDIYNNRNKKKLGGFTKKKLFTNAINRTMEDNENINDSSEEDEKIYSIKKSKIINNFSKDRIFSKKNNKIPHLNLINIYSNKNRNKSSDLNTNDSPINNVLESIFKKHTKYFE